MLGRRLVQPIDALAPTELGGSAPLIWDLLATESHVERIMAAMAERFNDPADVIEHGTQLAIRQLMDASLIDEVDE